MEKRTRWREQSQGLPQGMDVAQGGSDLLLRTILGFPCPPHSSGDGIPERSPSLFAETELGYGFPLPSLANDLYGLVSLL